MKTYHKINTIYKRDLGGTNKLIIGQWSLPEFEYLRNADWEFTEKVDGTNIRVIFFFDPSCGGIDVEFRGKTDNADIPKDLVLALEEQFYRKSLLDTARSMMMERKIELLTIYGEGYGPGIHGGGKYAASPKFVLFDVRVGEWWLDRGACEDIAERLDLDIVPIIGYGTLHDAVQIVRTGLGYDDTFLRSQWGDFEAEGIVARPTVPLFNRKMERIIAKIKVRDF